MRELDLNQSSDNQQLGKVRFSFEPEEGVEPAELFRLADESYLTRSPWSIDGFAEDMKSEHAYYGLAMNDEGCIGYMGYHLLFDEAEITNFVIEKNFQQQGIATRLLQAGLKQLKKKECKKIFLEVRESNQPAIRLYENNGFVRLGIRKNYYHEPEENAIIMQLTL